MSQTANDLFIQASRKKIRIATNRGQLATEDLWDLRLEDLDNIAIALDEKVQKAGKRSFIGKRDSAAAETDLAFEVVKFVIDTKLAEAEAARKRATSRQRREFLTKLLAEKEIENLKGLPVEDIQKQLAELDAEEAAAAA